MSLMRFAPFLVLSVLAACAVALPAPRVSVAQRVAAECRLLDQAAAQMAAQGRAAHDGLTEGCPGVSARDTRPLAQQTASLRAANAAALPASVAAGSRAENVFRRMITRCVPVGIATALADSPEFAAATE